MSHSGWQRSLDGSHPRVQLVVINLGGRQIGDSIVPSNGVQLPVQRAHSKTTTAHCHICHSCPLISNRIIAFHRRKIRFTIEAASCKTKVRLWKNSIVKAKDEQEFKQHTNVDKAIMYASSKITSGKGHRCALLPGLRNGIIALDVGKYRLTIESSDSEKAMATLVCKVD